MRRTSKVAAPRAKNSPAATPAAVAHGGDDMIRRFAEFFLARVSPVLRLRVKDGATVVNEVI